MQGPWQYGLPESSGPTEHQPIALESRFALLQHSSRDAGNGWLAQLKLEKQEPPYDGVCVNVGGGAVCAEAVAAATITNTTTVRAGLSHILLGRPDCCAAELHDSPV